MRIALLSLALAGTASWACASTTPSSTATGQPSPGSTGQTPIRSDTDQPADSRVPARHVIVISIDGLVPQSYTEPDAHGLKVPTLRRLRQTSAYSPGALSVFPSLTFPAHVTMVTGVTPAAHGIHSNIAWDPIGKNKSGWNWYAESITAPTVWQAAEEAGLRTALISWPVSVGANVDYLIPTYWRASTAEDVKLLRALSTPGLLDAIDSRFSGFIDRLTPPDVSDDIVMDAAEYLLATDPPNLMFAHLWKTDSIHHRHGLWSDEAKQSIERADAQLTRLIAAVEKAGIWPRTLLVIISDHGFMAMEKRIHLAAVLKEMKLITPIANAADKHRIKDDWKAVVVPNGGSAYVYLKDDNDKVTADAVLERMRELADYHRNGIAEIFDREQIRKRGGDPRAFLALEAKEGFVFGRGHDSELIADTRDRGHHGFDPARPGMKTALLLHGPGVKPGVIDDARLIDLAPTIASFLAIPLPGSEGRALPVY
ncbi:MAG: alkaline phosphatase family protein [Myxococcota bacterium]